MNTLIHEISTDFIGNIHEISTAQKETVINELIFRPSVNLSEIVTPNTRGDETKQRYLEAHCT